MEPHIHKTKEIKLKRIDRIENENYQGNAGDKSFLFRVCDCGHFQAFDYGATDKMKQLLKELK